VSGTASQRDRGALTGHLTRTLNGLGLKREPIDVTPVLNDYLPWTASLSELRYLPSRAEPVIWFWDDAQHIGD
jgi:hypothetical protein